MLYNTLFKKREECVIQEKHFLALAKENYKDKGLAKIYLMKRKIALETIKNIDNKILILQKQKNNI